MNATTSERLSTPPSTLDSRARPTQVDLYTDVHKGLRYLLANLLVALGQADFADEADRAAALAGLEHALWACDSHIAHEDTHVRPALADRAVRALPTLDAEHADHVQQVAELRALARALGSAEGRDEQNAIGRTLYLHFSVFVAETLAHMAYEERVVQPLVDRLLTADQLEQIHQRILASIPPPEMAAFLTSMLPAATREARARMVASVAANAPLEVLETILAEVRPGLRPGDWDALQRAL